MEYEAAVIVFGLMAYLLGSIPSSVWIGKSFYNIDVREHGSKNAGATNTFRVLGRKAGITVMAMDIMKGAAATGLPYLFKAYIIDVDPGTSSFINLQLALSLFVLAGHIFPLFAGFKGGKGVATLVGAFLSIHTFGVLICIGVFLLVLLTTNYVSLGSILATLTFPVLITLIFRENDSLLPYYAIGIFFVVLLTHKKNIKRLINGDENKIYLFR